MNEKKSGVHSSTGIHSVIIGAAIILCRISGFIRQRVFGHFLGISDAADIFNTSFRIPNLLQNLFGEGALSSSFIPVYSRLLSEGKIKEAKAVAGAVFSFLSLITALLVFAGIFSAPLLVSIIAPGFEGAKRQETIVLVRILFPGAGILALSAWCLGILNSHGRFFLSYAAPIVWNGAIIASLLYAGGEIPYRTAEYASIGSIIGSALQFLVQLPTVIRYEGFPKFSLSTRISSVKKVLKNFLPSLMTRGVVQIASFVDAGIASLLGSGAVAIISCAQTIYTLPVSLFGISVSAAELPVMSRHTSSEKNYSELRNRINKALSRLSFFVIPSAAAFFILGDVISAALYQTGNFDRQGVIFVWGAIAGASVGLLASTMGRLYSSAFFALHDTRTPFLFAFIRVCIGAPLCYTFARIMPSLFNINPQWGSAGITLASGLVGWIEYHLLKRSFEKRTEGKTGVSTVKLLKLYIAAVAAAAAAFTIKIIIGTTAQIHPVFSGLFILSAYGLCYAIFTYFLRIEEARFFIGKAFSKIVRTIGLFKS